MAIDRGDGFIHYSAHDNVQCLDPGTVPYGTAAVGMISFIIIYVYMTL